jgi:hypothetical protein
VERWVTDLAELPEQLIVAVRGLSDSQWETPYRPGGWTVRQVVHHLPDSHLNGYVRFKLALTEEEPVIKPYLEAEWARLPDVDATDPDVSLRLLDALHRRWVVLLRALDPAQMKRRIVHPEHGRAIELLEYLGMYAWHGRHHLAHITTLREREGWS